jgi:hypothetical protein
MNPKDKLEQVQKELEEETARAQAVKDQGWARARELLPMIESLAEKPKDEEFTDRERTLVSFLACLVARGRTF